MDRSGRGLALVWRRQIQQLNRVSLEMASAVVDAYPSPQLLIQVCHCRGHCPVCHGLSGSPRSFPWLALVRAQECLLSRLRSESTLTREGGRVPVPQPKPSIPCL